MHHGHTSPVIDIEYIKNKLYGVWLNGITRTEYIIEKHKASGLIKDILVSNYLPVESDQERDEEKHKIAELLYEILIKYQK